METTLPNNGILENLYVKEGHFNVIAWMPCPLKVPFRQMIIPYLETYNAKESVLPINCPEIMECPSLELDEILKNVQAESELPDVILTSSFSVLFSELFYSRIIKSGLMEGYTEAKNLQAIPTEIREQIKQYKLGVLAFSSWSIVQDLSVKTDLPAPTTWVEIISPEYKDQLSIHGCHGKAASASLLLFLKQQAGENAIEKFAHNIIDIRHFATIIKRLGSNNPNRTAFSLLPDVAVSHIPSSKPVKVLSLQEGRPLNPMILMVKRNRFEAAQPMIDVFYSDEFCKMLFESGYIMPEAIDWSEKFMLPDFSVFTEMGFEKTSAALEEVYQSNLRHELIDKRLKD